MNQTDYSLPKVFLMGTVADMEVRGQLACPRVKLKHKKRSWKSYEYMCLYVHVVASTHDVYMYKSVKTP